MIPPTTFISRCTQSATRCGMERSAPSCYRLEYLELGYIGQKGSEVVSMTSLRGAHLLLGAWARPRLAYRTVNRIVGRLLLALLLSQSPDSVGLQADRGILHCDARTQVPVTTPIWFFRTCNLAHFDCGVAEPRLRGAYAGLGHIDLCLKAADLSADPVENNGHVRPVRHCTAV